MNSEGTLIGSGLLASGGLCYLGGRTISKDLAKNPVSNFQLFENIENQHPKIAKFLKAKPKTLSAVLKGVQNYPKIMKYGGAIGAGLGATVLACSIFANN